jgi:hypothetical protein
LYLFKIIIIREWPEGWVGNLVISYALVGLFTYIISHTLINKEHKFYKKLPQIFFFSLFPLIIMLFLSINIRIKEYGYTESRYYVIAIAIWLLLISVLYLFTKYKALKYIPISMTIITIFTLFGPWSSLLVSEKSQQTRFEDILSKYDALPNGKVKAIEDTVAFKDQKNISSIIKYLYEIHGVESLDDYFNEDLTLLDTNKYNLNNYLEIVSLVGIDYISERQSNPLTDTYFNLNKDFNIKTAVAISNSDFYLTYNSYVSKGNKDIQEFKIDSSYISLSLLPKKMLVSYLGEEKEINIIDLVNQLKVKNHQNVSPLDFKLTVKLSSIEILFLFNTISGNINDDIITIGAIDANLFVKKLD